MRRDATAYVAARHCRRTSRVTRSARSAPPARLMARWPPPLSVGNPDDYLSCEGRLSDVLSIYLSIYRDLSVNLTKRGGVMSGRTSSATANGRS